MRLSCILLAWLFASASASAQFVLGFETCPPGFITAAGCAEGWAAGSSATVVPDPAGPLSSALLGFPTEGGQWVIVDGSGGLGFLAPPPAGGPAPYPFASPTSTGNIVFPMLAVPNPPPGFDVVISFDFTYCTPECASDPVYNDFFTADLVDPTSGLPVLSLLYRDTYASTFVSPIVSPTALNTIPTGFCTGQEAEEAPSGAPKSVSVIIPPILHGAQANLEFHVGNSTDNSFSSYFWLDNVQLQLVPQPLVVTLSSPLGPGSIQLDDSGLVLGVGYYNVFTVNEPCPGAPGSGPAALLGLCTTNIPSLLGQILLPANSPPFRILAAASTFTFGPFGPGALPSGVVLEVVCFDQSVTVISPVFRHVVP